MQLSLLVFKQINMRSIRNLLLCIFVFQSYTVLAQTDSNAIFGFENFSLGDIHISKSSKNVNISGYYILVALDTIELGIGRYDWIFNGINNSNDTLYFAEYKNSGGNFIILQIPKSVPPKSKFEFKGAMYINIKDFSTSRIVTVFFHRNKQMEKVKDEQVIFCFRTHVK
jgi:hypothetical protein